MKTKNEKRRKVLDAARSLFSRTHDFRRVSLEAIAMEAGVSPTTIYNYFGNRENLVYEVIQDLAQAVLEHNRTLVYSDLPFPQKLTGILTKKMDLARVVSGELIEKLISQDKRIAPFVDRLFQEEIKPLWLKIVADGKKEGYIDPDLDNEALLTYLDILQAGMRTKPELLRGWQEDNMGFVLQMTRLMFYGFLKKELDVFKKEEKQPYA
jgi:AcrR family transcriptional regulator